MLAELRSALGFARLRDVPLYARRLTGLAVSSSDDFLPPIDPAVGRRLSGIARAVRGPDAPPAIFVHGVLPRSGTNYLADMLELHPDVFAYPGRIWEFPLLRVADACTAAQAEFTYAFHRNAEVMTPWDMLAYVASGWLAAMQAEAGVRRILLKSPHVQNIGLFRHLFPDDILLLCLRDGRDVIQSSLRTFKRWPLGKSFRQMATEWRHGTDAILSFQPGGPNATPNAHVVYYEELVCNPAAAMRRVIGHARLDPEVYDFARLASLPVRGSSAVATQGEARWQPHEKPRDFAPVGRWKAWPPHRLSRFQALAGDALRRAGYEPAP
ncbi:MAG TPA: sulfotransferase [Azospirillum sp.]|nr:sulfotransferase [Azospirillum sp.]